MGWRWGAALVSLLGCVPTPITDTQPPVSQGIPTVVYFAEDLSARSRDLVLEAIDSLHAREPLLPLRVVETMTVAPLSPDVANRRAAYAALVAQRPANGYAIIAKPGTFTARREEIVFNGIYYQHLAFEDTLQGLYHDDRLFIGIPDGPDTLESLINVLAHEAAHKFSGHTFAPGTMYYAGTDDQRHDLPPAVRYRIAHQLKPVLESSEYYAPQSRAEIQAIDMIDAGNDFAAWHMYPEACFTYTFASHFAVRPAIALEAEQSVQYLLDHAFCAPGFTLPPVRQAPFQALAH